MTEIVYGNSTGYTMKKSKLCNNEIIILNAMFSMADLTEIDKYKIVLPEDIINEETEFSFKSKVEKIKNAKNIRIWCSYKEINSYLMLLYLCSVLNNNECDINVVFSDEYNQKYFSPAIMREYELFNASDFSRKLTNNEISIYANEWKKIKNINSEMRVMEEKNVRSVNYSYFDKIILSKLKDMVCVKESALAADLINEYVISDLVIVFLINNLIRNNKIKLLSKQYRAFDNIICINN